MKRIIMSIVFLSVIVSSVFAEGMKIGYVNSEQILAEYKEAKDAMAKLETETVKMQQEFQDMQKKGQELLEEYEKKKFVATDSWKKEKEKEIQDLQVELQNYQMEKFGNNGEIYKKEAEYLGPILEKINKILTQVGEEDNYDFILDASKGSIVFADPALDLTNVVLRELRK
ncbi:MAG: OmpH family outer membrane protein [Candidatus Marinimicrobia bacterium]|nr:OmpH family outer membrane protein [Candidatus Neomarinimicrobiota bacterium]